jgi:hypothetical protein
MYGTAMSFGGASPGLLVVPAYVHVTAMPQLCVK